MELYALVTAARNEEKYIEKTLKSVTSQTILPGKWIIVSDGSTDCTDEIVRHYALRYKFIHLLRRVKESERSFASKVFALNAGMQLIELDKFEFVGNLDADVSFEPSYFQDLFQKFEEDAGLGIAGGFIYEEIAGGFASRKDNCSWSVAGAVQMFRRECCREIGPFVPIQYGGEDWYAEVAARMGGWRVQSFPEFVVLHHRATGSTCGLLRSRYREGLMDYSIGCHPVFEVTKLVPRILHRPFLLGALTRFAGFTLASLRRKKRMVPSEFVSFLRKEQMARLLNFGRRYFQTRDDTQSPLHTP